MFVDSDRRCKFTFATYRGINNIEAQRRAFVFQNERRKEVTKAIDNVVLERVVQPTAFQAKRFFERVIARYRTLPVFVADEADSRWCEADYARRWYNWTLRHYPDKFKGRRIVQDRDEYIIHTGDGHWNPVLEIALVPCPQTTSTGNTSRLAILMLYGCCEKYGTFWLDQ